MYDSGGDRVWSHYLGVGRMNNPVVIECGLTTWVLASRITETG
jgi:hypothetical protein